MAVRKIVNRTDEVARCNEASKQSSETEQETKGTERRGIKVTEMEKKNKSEITRWKNNRTSWGKEKKVLMHIKKAKHGKSEAKMQKWWHSCLHLLFLLSHSVNFSMPFIGRYRFSFAFDASIQKHTKKQNSILYANVCSSKANIVWFKRPIAAANIDLHFKCAREREREDSHCIISFANAVIRTPFKNSYLGISQAKAHSKCAS